MFRFPEDFMFQLTEFELTNLKSQIATSSWGGRRKLPYVFTEHGVLMLSSVLNSEKAVSVNIQIMRIFTKVRQMLTDNLSVKLDIEEIKKKLQNQDKNIDFVFFKSQFGTSSLIVRFICLKNQIWQMEII